MHRTPAASVPRLGFTPGAFFARALILRVAPLLVLAIALVASPVAHAQSSTDLVGRPLTTKRLERLLRAYVSPTPEEASAIDRLHEAYLDRFRRELEPQFEKLTSALRESAPTIETMTRTMRDADRLQAQLAEADNALFAAAMELVAEERRPGFQRIRDARERQRELGGFVRFGAMVFAPAGNFVDLADLVTRDAVMETVPDDARERLDAFLATQEARLLAQAREWNRTVIKSFEAYYAVMFDQAANFAESQEGEAPEAAARRSQASARAMMDAMQRAAAEPRKLAAANYQANRRACIELATILPEGVVAGIREQVARRALGAGWMSMEMAAGFHGPDGTPADVARRMRRDPRIDDAAKSRADEIAAEWRTRHADALERCANAFFDPDRPAASPFGLSFGMDDEPARDADPLVQAAKDAGEITQRAMRALIDLLGEDMGRRYVMEIEGETGPIYVALQQADIGDDAAAGTSVDAVEGEAEPATADGNMDRMIEPRTTAAILSGLAMFGVAPANPELVESVRAAWLARTFEPVVGSLVAECRRLQKAVVTQTADGTWSVDHEKQRAADAMIARIMLAALEADEVLIRDLASVLGLDPAGGAVTALRLDRVAMIEADVRGMFDTGADSPVTPLETLRRAGVSPETASAVFERSAEAWTALCGELEPHARAMAAGRDEVMRLQQDLSADSDFEASDSGTQARRVEAMMAAWSAHQRRSREFGQRLASTFDEACAKAIADEDTLAKLRRAHRELRYPEIYAKSDCASEQLAHAMALPGLDDDQFTRLEVLRAEYEVVFEELSRQMIDANTPLADPGPDAWREQMRIMETTEKLRFQRNERTEKARSEARRILGDDLARRIPGLAPTSSDPAPSTRPTSIWPFDDDED